jgi:hypothetical protein
MLLGHQNHPTRATNSGMFSLGRAKSITISEVSLIRHSRWRNLYIFFRSLANFPTDFFLQSK